MRISDWSSDVCSSDLIAVFWWLFGYSGAPIPSLHFVHGRSSGSCVGRLASVILASARLMPRVRMNRNQRQTKRLKVEHPKIGRAHVRSPATNANRAWRRLLEKKRRDNI